MKAKIVLTIEDALTALRKEEFDMAVVLHEPTEDNLEPHATLLVSRSEFALQIFDYEYPPKQIDEIDGFSAFYLSDFETIILTGNFRLDRSMLKKVFPDIEIVNLYKWRFDDECKVVEFCYPYIHWSSIWGLHTVYVIHFSKDLWSDFSSHEEALEQIEWAVRRGFIYPDEKLRLESNLKGLTLLKTKIGATAALLEVRHRPCK